MSLSGQSGRWVIDAGDPVGTCHKASGFSPPFDARQDDCLRTCPDKVARNACGSGIHLPLWLIHRTAAH